MKIFRKNTEQSGKFRYVDKHGKEITDAEILEYLNKLKTPPKYSNVIIFYPPNSHKLLYSGVDEASRTQWIYSPKWKAKAKKKYFADLARFGKMLPKISAKINSLLKSSRFTKQKQIALILRIVILCNFRIGNQKYEKLYNSHGISTIQRRHIKFLPNKRFHVEFIGKKGVKNYCIIDEPLLYDTMQDLLKNKSPNDYLFTYTNAGETKRIKATDINNWLKTFDSAFTSKMFRTFATNCLLIARMKELNPKQFKINKRKKNLVQFFKEVSELVHNTPCICRKDYANTDMVNLYLNHPRKWNKLFANVSPRVGFTNFLLKMK